MWWQTTSQTMSNSDKRRGRMAAEAARRLARGGDMKRARVAAARRIGRGWVPEHELPSAAAISRELARQRLTAEPDRTGGHAALIGDHYDALASFLRPLAAVRLDPRQHHAVTLLDASLLAFAHVEGQRPYDEELLTAALLADAGQFFDRRDPVRATLEEAAAFLTERTAWLIENRNVAIGYRDQSLGRRGRQRLAAHSDFDAVLLLAEAFHEPAQTGQPEHALEDAIAVLRQLAASY
jgi:hypothetical protein